MLAGVLNIPHDQDAWNFWAWQHRLSHDKIRSAIQSKYNQTLTDYQIEPMTSLDVQQFLQNNSSLHSDMNAVLGLTGIDLLDVDLSKDNQKNAWIYWHYIEHYNAEAKLGIGS